MFCIRASWRIDGKYNFLYNQTSCSDSFACTNCVQKYDSEGFKNTLSRSNQLRDRQSHTTSCIWASSRVSKRSVMSTLYKKELPWPFWVQYVFFDHKKLFSFDFCYVKIAYPADILLLLIFLFCPLKLKLSSKQSIRRCIKQCQSFSPFSLEVIFPKELNLH